MQPQDSQKITFDECAFDPDRRDLAEFLTSFLVQNSSKGYVLNINGAWGAGKTFFSQAWKNKLSEKYASIYIDAWKTDYSNEPLIVIMKELLDELKKLNKESGINSELEKKVLKGLYKITSSTVKMSASIASAMIGVGSSSGEKAAELMLNDLDTFVENAGELDFKHYKIVYNAMDDFKSAITSLLSSYFTKYSKERPLFIFIDELDRCRPTYAVEVLETIKHIFGLENIVFIVTTNTDELKHSINAVYGTNFSSEKYLDRFFNRSIILPEPTVSKYLDAAHSVLIDRISQMQKFIKPDNIAILDTMSIAFIAFDYKLRDIDRFMDALRGVLHWVYKKSSNDTKIDIVNLVILMILQKQHPEAFNRIKSTEDFSLPKVDTKAAKNAEFMSYKNSAPFPQLFQTSIKFQKLYEKLLEQSINKKKSSSHITLSLDSLYAKTGNTDDLTKLYIRHYEKLASLEDVKLVSIEELAQFVETSSILNSAE